MYTLQQLQYITHMLLYPQQQAILFMNSAIIKFNYQLFSTTNKVFIVKYQVPYLYNFNHDAIIDFFENTVQNISQSHAIHELFMIISRQQVNLFSSKSMGILLTNWGAVFALQTLVSLFDMYGVRAGRIMQCSGLRWQIYVNNTYINVCIATQQHNCYSSVYKIINQQPGMCTYM